MRFRLRLIAFAALASLAFAPSSVSSQGLTFDAYMQLVAAKARAQGVSEPAINTVLAGLQPSQRVIALDRDNTTSPNGVGFPPFAPYLASHNTPARVAGGRRVYQQLGPLAAQVQQRYGVPAPIILAIWGHETSYGAVRGNFDLAQALATLAWEGRRRALFETELIDLMKMVQQGVPRSRLVGR